MERDKIIASKLNRRAFLILVGAATTAQKAFGRPPPASPSRIIDAGPASNYASDGLYARLSDQGFFIVRKGQQLQALSAFCTHRRCKLSPESDHSFYCRCHGSTFDPNGKATAGPAKRNLPALPYSINEKGHLMVTLPAA